MSTNYIRAATFTVEGGSSWTLVPPPGDSLRLRMQIKQFTEQSPNLGTVRITNPDPKKVLPLKGWEGKKLTIDAGYQDNHGVLFVGSIKQAIYGRENPTDTCLTLFAADLDRAHNYAVVNTTLKPGSKPVDHVNAALQAMGQIEPVTVGFIGGSVDLSAPVYPRAVTLFGLAREVLARVARSKQAQVSYQNGALQMVGRNDTSGAQAIVLNTTTGLIGMPTQTIHGIEARVLINPNIKINTNVQIAQDLIQQTALTIDVGGGTEGAKGQMPDTSADGIYKVLQINVDGDSRASQPWYMDLVLSCRAWRRPPEGRVHSSGAAKFVRGTPAGFRRADAMTEQVAEMIDSELDSTRAAIRGHIAEVWTALPAIITKTSDGHRATAKSALNALVLQLDGTLQSTAMPLFDTAIIKFAGGGQVVATHPVVEDDEGTVIFSSRNIDSWAQNGGVQDPIDLRAHHLADAKWIPGGRSDPNKLTNVSQAAHHVRSVDAKHTIELHATRGTTIKHVPASDASTNPFGLSTDEGGNGAAGALSFFQSLFHPTNGIAHQGVVPGTTHQISIDMTTGPRMRASNDAHQSTVDPTNGPLLSAAGGAHTVSVNPASGIISASSKNITSTAAQALTMTGEASATLASSASSITCAGSSITMSPGGQITATDLASGAAATNVGTLAGVLGGTLPNPAMAAGAASANVGTLGGALTGTLPNPGLAPGVASTSVGAVGGDLSGYLPNPLVISILHVYGASLPSFDNGADANAGGVPVGGLFQRSGTFAVTVCNASDVTTDTGGGGGG